jgi:hypothetical protein
VERPAGETAPRPTTPARVRRARIGPDISSGGAAVRLPQGAISASSEVELALPGSAPVVLQTVRVVSDPGAASDVVSLRIRYGDWAAYRTLSLWLFHTPPGVVAGLPAGAPAVAAELIGTSRRTPTLQRQFG